MSTHTYGSSLAARKSRVSRWLSSVIQVRLRNSTQIRRGATRRAQARMYSLLAREIGNQGGNWNRIAPSFPPPGSEAPGSEASGSEVPDSEAPDSEEPRSGSSAARTRSQADSVTAGVTSWRYFLTFS